MTTWYGGNGWGWCSGGVNIPAMLLLWGVIIAATILAVRVALRERSDPPAATSNGFARANAAMVARISQAIWTTTNFTAG
ncbi:MAG: hypothetical protein K2X97_07235 [Mycobacteriaceae bacterium]|nr:hypothetical protein [Mycobacteriaceae bacterium]